METWNAFDSYAAWTDEVAKYPPTAEPYYLALGIAEECGELMTCKITETEAEGGDVLWYCARYATRVLKVPFSQIVADARHMNGMRVHPVAASIGQLAGYEKKRIRDGELWDEEKRLSKAEGARRALTTIVSFVHFQLLWAGSTIELAISANRKKLTARLEAGTIRGDGDHR